MENDKERLGFLNLLIIILSIYVLLSLIISALISVPVEIEKLLAIIDDSICVVFLLEFGIRFLKAENKLHFMRWGWIDLVSSIPAFPFARIGRLFRLVRLLRILRAFRSTRVLVNHVFKNKIQGTITAVSLITILVVIFSSISILIVEKDPGSNIKSAEDALWWSIVTVTTVGYGDKYPVTTEGRLIGVILMFVGVGVFGVFTGYIASWFTQENKSDEKIGLDD